MQRLALFDLDNTLVDRSTAVRRWAAEFSAEHSLPVDATAWLGETRAAVQLIRPDAS